MGVGLLLLLPLSGVVALNLLPRRLGNQLALPLTLVLAALLVVGVLLAHPLGLSVGATDSSLFGLHLSVDLLSFIMLLAIGLVVLTAACVAFSLTDGEERFRFANLALLAAAGMNGVVLVTDLFSLYVFLEVVGVCAFVLIAIRREKRGLEGSFKYLVLSVVATSLFLTGLALLFIAAGDTSFAAVATAVRSTSASKLTLVAMALFTSGLCIKAGLVPFHGWLPDAYAGAPAPVSVLLAGIITKTCGVYTLIRLGVAVFGASSALREVLLVTGAISILVGAVLAIGQHDFKRMLAYSSISQVGYIILALGVGTPLGIAAAVFHLFNHAIFKSLLFVNAAALEKQAGTTDMSNLGGLSSRMPVTSATSLIGMLSTAGIPPLSGFWSKLLIIVAAFTAGRVGYAAFAAVLSVVTLAYFLSMQRRVFFGKLVPSLTSLREAGVWAVAPALLLSAVTLLLGLAAPWLSEALSLPWATIASGGL